MGIRIEGFPRIEVAEPAQAGPMIIDADHPAVRDRQAAELGHIHLLARSWVGDAASRCDFRIVKEGCIHRVTSCEKDS